MSDTRYTVAGMSCEHCVRAVSAELAKVAGVESVAVDLGSGVVTVGGASFTDDQVAAAVDEAGYTLVN